MRKHRKIVGRSYLYRVDDILRIYDEHSRSGLSNREKTFYNIINASAEPRIIEGLKSINTQLSLF